MVYPEFYPEFRNSAEFRNSQDSSGSSDSDLSVLLKGDHHLSIVRTTNSLLPI